MNKFLMLIIVSLLVAGCASDSPKEPSPSPAQRELNPEAGMTKDQVIERYGRTDRITNTSEGEVWVYLLNLGQAFIPFNFGYHPKVLTIFFDPVTGKVTHWSYSH